MSLTTENNTSLPKKKRPARIKPRISRKKILKRIVTWRVHQNEWTYLQHSPHPTMVLSCEAYFRRFIAALEGDGNGSLA